MDTAGADGGDVANALRSFVARCNVAWRLWAHRCRHVTRDDALTMCSMLRSITGIAHGEIMARAAAGEATVLAHSLSNAIADAMWTFATGRALRTCNVAEPQLFTVLAMVSETHKAHSGGERFTARLIPSRSMLVRGILIARQSNETVDASVHDRGDGTYTVLYKVDTPGSYQLEVRLVPRDAPGTHGTHIRGSPFAVEVVAPGVSHFDSGKPKHRHAVPVPYFRSVSLHATSALRKQLHTAQVAGFDDPRWLPATKSSVRRDFAHWSHFESPAAEKPSEFKIGVIFDILEENVLRRSRRFFHYHSAACHVLRSEDGPVHFLDLRRRTKLVVTLQLLDGTLVPSRCSNVFSGEPFMVSRYPQDLTLRRQMWQSAMDGGRARALASVYCTHGANLQQLIVSADLHLHHKVESMDILGNSLLLIPMSAEVVVDGFSTVFCLRSLLAVKVVNHRRIAVDDALRQALRSAKTNAHTAMPRAAYVVSTNEVPELCDWRGRLSVRLRHIHLEGLSRNMDGDLLEVLLCAVRPQIGSHGSVAPEVGPVARVRCNHSERVDVEPVELSVDDIMHDELLLRMHPYSSVTLGTRMMCASALVRPVALAVTPADTWPLAEENMGRGSSEL